ncbi:MAG: hypothetical protein DCF22_02270 [Leptolyngbya sp.]|nr:MAG: hypothetical protein DCF22_02270 [Leptolyngbya sp.]
MKCAVVRSPTISAIRFPCFSTLNDCSETRFNFCILLLSLLSASKKTVQGSIVKAHCGNSQLIHFLQEKLKLSTNAIAIALRHCEQDPGPLPMILWQYGLVSLEELDQIFDWLES